MPKLKYRVPSYRHHKASGQAVVALDGRDVYLGPYGTDESRERYQRVISEWLTNRKKAPPNGPTGHAARNPVDLTINELFLPYWEFVQGYYRKHGQPTSEARNTRAAMDPLLVGYGRVNAKNFGPLALKAYRQGLIDVGFTRGVINKHVGRVKRFFRWAVEHELISPDVYQALTAVTGLRRGRVSVPESSPVRPVADDVVDATLEYVNRYVAAMIQLQRFTGMRPSEVTIMRLRDLDTSGDDWIYRPESHKTEHYERERVIYLGPRAQEVLRPFLIGELHTYFFSPRRVMEEFQACRRATAGTHKTYKRIHTPKKRPGERYTTNSYEHSIHRGSDKAFPPPEGVTEGEIKAWRKQHRWSPNQLRHSAATFLRKEFGIDAARVVLGHASPAITEVYAELDHTKAAEIMLKVG